MTDPTRTRRASLSTTAIVALAALTGCAGRHDASAGTRPNDPAPSAPIAEAVDAAPGAHQSTGWTSTPLAVVSEPVAVKEGAAPLAYLVETPGMFRVRDRTTGQDLARGSAPSRSIIRVDGRAGVVFSRETLVPGPLAIDHQYVIYRDPTGPNMIRQGTFQPVPQGRLAPLQQPGGAPTAAYSGAEAGPSQDAGVREDQGGPRASH